MATTAGAGRQSANSNDVTTWPLAGDVMEHNKKAVQRLSRGLSSLSHEMARFMESRIREDMGSWSKLVDCRTLEDAIACQRGFVVKATEEYFAEAGKLSDLWFDIASEMLPAAAAGPASPRPTE